MEYTAARGPPANIIIETGGVLTTEPLGKKIVQIFDKVGEKHFRVCR